MDERLRFVARLLEGEKMALLCREFDISRKTGYKIFQSYEDCGVHGLTDRSRRPYRHANKLPLQVETRIVQLKRERPSWGAPKIREKLRRSLGDIRLPAISTVHAVLVQSDGSRDVLGLWIEQTEGAKFWMKVINDLRSRGVEEGAIQSPTSSPTRWSRLPS